MFRFTIRDMLWLTILVGLALVWRQEHQDRQSKLQALNRFEVVADEPSLSGSWEIVEKTSNGKAYDLGGKSAGYMMFDSGNCLERDSPDHPDFHGEYTIVGPGEIDIDMKMVPTFGAPVWKWRYELKGGELRIIRSNGPRDRPKDFDAISDPGLTLYVLKKPVAHGDAIDAERSLGARLEAFNKDRLEAIKRKMMPWVGKNVSVTGTLHSGKIAEFVAIDDGGSVHVKAITEEGIAKKVELGRLIGKRVSVTGTLQYSENTPPLRPDDSGIPEHFYIDIAQATIRKAGHER